MGSSSLLHILVMIHNYWKKPQCKSTRDHSYFKLSNYAVALFFWNTQYQISQVVGYHPILLNWCQSYVFSISWKWDTGLIFVPLKKIEITLLCTSGNYIFSNNHIWELLGNYRDFGVVVGIYYFHRRTRRIIVTTFYFYKFYIHIQ